MNTSLMSLSNSRRCTSIGNARKPGAWEQARTASSGNCPVEACPCITEVLGNARSYTRSVPTRMSASILHFERRTPEVGAVPEKALTTNLYVTFDDKYANAAGFSKSGLGLPKSTTNCNIIYNYTHN